MKIWTKIKLKDRDRDIHKISKSLTKYLYKDGPINNIIEKYHIKEEEKIEIEKYTTNRVAGLLMLYSIDDIKRINDIVNKYNVPNNDEVNPELEGYIDK